MFKGTRANWKGTKISYLVEWATTETVNKFLGIGLRIEETNQLMILKMLWCYTYNSYGLSHITKYDDEMFSLIFKMTEDHLEDIIKDKFNDSFTSVVKDDAFYASPEQFYDAYNEEVKDQNECSFEKWTSIKLFENISDYTGSNIEKIYEEFVYLLITKLKSELRKL
jgi:hypothetical protein